MSKDDHPKLLLTASAACLAGGVLWLVLKPSAPAPVAPPPVQTPKPKPVMRLPAVQPLKSPPPKEEPVSKPAPTPTAVSATTTALSSPAKRDKAAWETLLAKIAPEGYGQTHPGVLAKLADLLVTHEGDEEWEAGAVAYLGGPGLRGEAALALWKRAAEALPENLAVSNALVRYALEPLGARYKDMDALLDQQIARTPQDAHLFWLKAEMAFKDNRGEDAEALLRKTADLPPWKDKAGIAERGGLQVREAMDGPLDSIGRFGTMAGVLVPDLSRYKDLVNNTAARADLLIKGMEYDRAKDLLLQADRMGHRIEDGGHMVITLLVGMAVEGKVLAAQKSLATATGDLILLQETDRRLAELQTQRNTVKAWSKDQSETWAQIESIYERYDLTPDAWQNPDRLKAVETYMTPDEKELLRQLSESFPHEADDLRRALAATPPTP